ncbi:RNA polymerase sigma-I factor [Acetivibrio mesophilus]|uniref:RNA polymerase sigma factor SigI n=1 Tax=Acetivibrio mesophilus TaxID=2487273 RepID=A0A4Q0IB57_9FIRM|nr:RNA polymerase sigma-I factor [Acetivibrio mesophilus]ODM25738.1 RNA polymerase sigma-I factor [Clostridium sp. Bc-iso-3]RXE60322.1 RNA polymerase sigma-I factor [Acetivibrio mesophilus]HHV30447.1 RNA polymerase sigma-I factor [Clostridium sp.]
MFEPNLLSDLRKREKKSRVDSINHIVIKIKNGDTELKEKFIKKYRPYLLKIISSTLGRYVDPEVSEEYSVGLMAFNEAIDGFNPDINGNFTNYCNMVVNHRIIDYIRKNKKYSNVIPFSYFEERNDFEEKYLVSDSHYLYENIEVKEEVLQFEQQLKQFGITLEDLVVNSPKHKDSRELCINIARVLAENDKLFDKLLRKKCIPLSELMGLVSVHRKTVERNRKFIIAVSLVLRSSLDEIKQFFKEPEEGRGQ